MLREAAESLNVSHVTLRKFIRDDNENLGPSKCVFFGKSKIYLYTLDDVTKIAKYLEERKTVLDNDGTHKLSARGRPAIWTKEERKERQRKFARASYYKRKAQNALAIGTTEEYLEATKKAEEIIKQLKEEK